MSLRRLMFDHKYEDGGCRSLGIKDDRGRDIGALISIRTETVVADDSEPDPERDRWRSRTADELQLGDSMVYVRVQPARNGKSFGASLDHKRIGLTGPETNAKIVAEVERRIASMTKRYRKQFGKGA